MKKILLIFVPFLLLACLAFFMHNGYFEKGIAIDDKTFPDAKFREQVKYYDKNGNGYLGQYECEYVYSFKTESCSSIQGIETFPNISNVDITNVDDVSALENLSKLSVLKLRDCSGVNLDFNKFKSLSKLNIYNCVIVNEINMTGLEYLNRIEMDDSQFDTLVIKDCPAFHQIGNFSSTVKDIRLENLPEINSFSSVDDARLEKLHCINCPKLFTVKVTSAPELSEVEFKGCSVLQTLELPKCKITEVDLRECPVLAEAINDDRTFTEECKISRDKGTGRMQYTFDRQDFGNLLIYYYGDVSFITK